jgi:hypothetical protein
MSSTYDLTRLASQRNLNHWYPFGFIFMWKSLHVLRPCSCSLRSHLSQLGSLGDTRVHLMQSDRSPPTPRPLGANPRNARPYNITLAIRKNGTRFDGLTLLQSEILPVIIHYPQPTCKQSEFNVPIAIVQILLNDSRKIPFLLSFIIHSRPANKASSTFQSQSFKFY